MKMTYTVKNLLGVQGESHHRKVRNALDAADKREGFGWQVVDSNGVEWVWNSGHAPEMVYEG